MPAVNPKTTSSADGQEAAWEEPKLFTSELRGAFRSSRLSIVDR
jgi:hypothetical protein